MISSISKMPDILKQLDDDTRRKAMIIAEQIMSRQNIKHENAIMIAVALAKAAK